MWLKKNEYAERLREEIDNAVSNSVSYISGMEIFPLINYAIGHDGKRLRPMMSIVIAEALGKRREDVMNLALAFEMLHTATLVHDDIIDGDELRRRAPSVNKRWGRDAAILVGDALISLGIRFSSSYGQEVISRVADYGISLCNGEYIDIAEERNTDVDYYLRKIYLKSASLFKAVAECAGVAADAQPNIVSKLSRFGENFGMAYQIRDDIVDTFINGNEPGKDLIDGKITLPLVYLYNMSDEKGRGAIRMSIAEIRSEKDVSARISIAKSIVEMMHDSGSIDYSKKMISDYTSKGLDDLEVLPEGFYRDYLKSMLKGIESGEISP